MGLKEKFQSEWRNNFANAPLPDLRCLRVAQGQNDDEINRLTLDAEELKEKIDQVKFSYDWVIKQKDNILRSLELESEPNTYANLNSMTRRPAPRLTERSLTEPNIPTSSGFLKHSKLAVVAPAKNRSLNESYEEMSPLSLAGMKLDNVFTGQYLMMKKLLAKKLSVEECQNLCLYFGAINFDTRAKITTATSFIDLLESIDVISELDVNDLLKALEVEKLQEASDVVNAYKESIFSTDEDEERYLKMEPVTEDNFDRIVTDDDLRVLSLCIDKSFKAFGREVLKFTAKEIEKFQRQSDCEHKQASNMLHKWKQRLGHLATVSKLTSLLKDFNYGPDVWGFLEGIPMDVTEGDSSGEKQTPEFETFQSIVVKTYIKHTPDQLSIKKGEKILIQDRGRIGWYYGEVMNQQGWIPNYCVREEDASEKQYRFLFVVETLTDSSRGEENFLTYRRSEHLDVIEERFENSKALYRARNKDGVIGLVLPSNCSRLLGKESILFEREWFHSKVLPQQAEKFLRRCPSGTYLIREASKTNDLVLNVKTADDINKFLIKTTNFGYKILDKKFKSITEMIAYYKRFSIRDSIYLTVPLSKQY
ncbi:putative cytoplasmic protein NCK2-like isoform X2 [Apostichopus japonicus]|uniref:Putative cytoplasmic protein NCK2-like isoform X2 n=1 Tax=Stichopus japonicus TaxID=307972 RepID=A0A2G8LD76_STIJA|nr:putative cytoplasmic protein NCK2-like isoform X2 [Apostichopus japonicus]